MRGIRPPTASDPTGTEGEGENGGEQQPVCHERREAGGLEPSRAATARGYWNRGGESSHDAAEGGCMLSSCRLLAGRSTVT